jgi:hypothetical protein
VNFCGARPFQSRDTSLLIPLLVPCSKFVGLLGKLRLTDANSAFGSSAGFDVVADCFD